MLGPVYRNKLKPRPQFNGARFANNLLLLLLLTRVCVGVVLSPKSFFLYSFSVSKITYPNFSESPKVLPSGGVIGYGV